MISVVIPALNATALIGPQLDALAAQQTDEAFEVIVADNGSTDGTTDYCSRWRSHLTLRIVDASAKRGPAAAQNAGARAARGDVLAFSGADDIVGRGWVRAWQQLSPDFAFGGGPTPSFRDGDPPPALDTSTVTMPPTFMGFLPYVTGMNLAVRRSVFEAAGGFREDRLTAEDIELCWRLQLAGHPFTFVPDAIAAHRRARGVGAILRKYYHYGLSDPFLYREFRDRGLRPAPALPTLRSYAGLIARIPLLGNLEQRERWATQLGRRVGRIVGSVKARTLLPLSSSATGR